MELRDTLRLPAASRCIITFCLVDLLAPNLGGEGMELRDTLRLLAASRCIITFCLVDLLAPNLGENRNGTEGRPRTPGRDESLHSLGISKRQFQDTRESAAGPALTRNGETGFPGLAFGGIRRRLCPFAHPRGAISP